MGTATADAGLKDLQALSQLQELYLARTGITDAGLKQLSGLSQLQVLHVEKTKTTPAGLKELQKALPKLKTVR